MARYQITGPDGGTYEITAPDNASEKDVMDYAVKSMGTSVQQGNPFPNMDAGKPGADAAQTVQNRFSTFEGGGGGKPQYQPIDPRAEPEPDVMTDVAKSAGSGAIAGALAVPAMPNAVGQLIQKGGEAADARFGANPQLRQYMNERNPGGNLAGALQMLPSFGDIRRKVETVTGPLPFHKPETTAGKYAHTAGEFASGLLMPGGPLQKVIGNTLAPAVASEAAGQATEGTPLEPVARLGGALLGGKVSNLPARAYTPAPATPERLAQVRALENEGVTSLTAGQKTGNVNLRYAEDAAMNTPFSGSRAADIKQAQGQEFTRAAWRKVGIDADNVAPQTMDFAFQHLGQKFDAMGAVTTAKLAQSDLRAIDQAVMDYERITAPSQRLPAIRETIDDLRQVVNTQGATLPGDVYARYRSLIEADARSLQASDGVAADTLRKIKNVLDDAAERSVPASLKKEWQTTRQQYRNLLVLEKAAAKSSAAEGQITPAALLQAFKTVQGNRNYVRGRGDMAELARSGYSVLKELPNSGTAQRQSAMQLGQMAAGGALGAFGYGGPEGAAAGAVAPFLLKGMMARGMMSTPMQRYLGNQALPANVISAQRSAYSSLPAAAGSAVNPLFDGRQP